MNKFNRLLASILILAPLPALAQSEADPTAAADSFSEELILFQEIPSVFGASKYDQKPAEAPASITVITAEEIRYYGYRTLADILRSVRGFFTTYDRNYSYVGVRGFGRPGDYNTRILLLQDGHRINDNVYDQASVGSESIVAVETIDRVEIIRGPSSSIYGTNAFFAVVNVITKTGRQMKGTELALSGASHSTLDGHAAYGNKLGTGAEVYAYGSYYDSDGQNLYYPEYDDPDTNNGWANDNDRDKVVRFLGKFSSGNFSLEGAGSSRHKTVPTASYETIFDDPSYITTDQRAYLLARYNRPMSDGSSLTGSLSYDIYRYYGDYPYTEHDGGMYGDEGIGQWWTGEVQSVRTVGKHHKVIGGAEVRLNTQQDQKGYDESPYTYLDDRRSSTIWALYLQDEFRVRDNIIVNLGLRHDDYENFGGTTNPRLAVIYSTRRDMTLKFLYGKAFRAPNMYELYYDDGGWSMKANPELGPETVSTYQFEMSWPIGDRFRATALVYDYRIRGLITQVIDPDDDLTVFRNVNRVKSDGIELQVEGRFARHLRGRVSYAYQRTEDMATGDTLSNSPRHLAKCILSIPMLEDRLSAGLEVLYTSGRLNVLGTAVPDYTLANLNFVFNGWKKGPSLALGIYNLLDRDYGDPGGIEHLQASIPQDGRNYRLQVRYEF